MVARGFSLQKKDIKFYLVSKLIGGGLFHWTIPALEYWRMEL